MAIASIAIAGGVIGASAAPRIKFQLKQWILEHPDQNCGAAAALFDEQSGWTKVRTGLGLARALGGGDCSGLLGEFAIASRGDSGAVTSGSSGVGAGDSGDLRDTARPSNDPLPSRPGDLADPQPTLVTRSAEARPRLTHRRPSRTVVEDPTRIAMDAPPATYSHAREIVASLEFGDLGRAETVHPRIGLRTRQYLLPSALTDSVLVLDVLGQRLPMLSGDRLPSGVVAIHVTPPKNNVGALGPFVWTRAADEAKRIFGTIMQADYHALGYPRYLLAEIFLNDFNRDGGTPFRPTDRVGDYVGAELEHGWIEHGTIYLCVDPKGSWRLREYPDFPARGDCVHLVWNFNPRVEPPGQVEGAAESPPGLVDTGATRSPAGLVGTGAVTGTDTLTRTEALTRTRRAAATDAASRSLMPRREGPTPPAPGRRIVPPDWLVQEQTAHQIVSVETARYGGPLPTNIGPSILFRTDMSDPDGQSDLLVFAPFLYLDNPELLRDLILSAPLPDGSLPDEDRLLVASGDLHYISNGNLRPLLDYRFGASHIQLPADDARPTDVDLWANHVGFYLGMERLPDADVSQR